VLLLDRVYADGDSAEGDAEARVMLEGLAQRRAAEIGVPCLVADNGIPGFDGVTSQLLTFAAPLAPDYVDFGSRGIVKAGKPLHIESAVSLRAPS
jgi:hypothetical protein